MALFTDADVITLDDLLQLESTLVQVSSTHVIDIQTKIKLAKDEIGDKILLFLLRAGRSDHQWFSRAIVGLNTVFVTPAIYKWLCCDSLYRVFAEAYNVQLNTRFQGKLLEYQKQADAASEIVFASGIAVVPSPLQRPALPVLATAVGTMTGSTLFVQTTWVNAAGQESALSPVNGVVLNGFSRVIISMAEKGTAIPFSAIGWNIYASESQQNLTRQNSSPLSVSIESWAMPQSGLVSGRIYPGAQAPNSFVSANRRWNRG